MLEMRGREFITLVSGATVALPLAAQAEQGERVRHIGRLMPLAANDPDARPRVSAFQQRLQMLGWANGHNVQIDYRWAPGDTARMRAEAAELVSQKPDVIVASSTPAVEA